jgi:hypothetical protein
VRINHRIALRGDSPFWKEIQALGLPYDPGRITVLNITEDDAAWPEVERLLSLHGSPVHLINNLFTRKEIEGAEWLEARAQGHHGYPQPEDNFGYIQQTYDTTGYCPRCGIGGVQKAPFRLRAEPKVEHSHFLQLNWVFDELFIRREVSAALKESGITGLSFLPPILHERNRPSERIVQMKVDTVLPAGPDTSGLEPVTCIPDNEESHATAGTALDTRVGPYCHRTKHHRMKKGPFRFARDAFAGAPDVVKSREWFGSGASAHRLIIVSRRFREIVSQLKWRGIAFEPIELTDVPPPGHVKTDAIGAPLER